jgi:hypothetical protein
MPDIPESKCPFFDKALVAQYEANSRLLLFVYFSVTVIGDIFVPREAGRRPPLSLAPIFSFSLLPMVRRTFSGGVTHPILPPTTEIASSYPWNTGSIIEGDTSSPRPSRQPGLAIRRSCYD